MSKTLDYMGAFKRRAVTCRHCGWSGRGADMEAGDSLGHGMDFHCPACGERYGFVQYPVVVPDDAPDDWPAKIPPVAD